MFLCFLQMRMLLHSTKINISLLSRQILAYIFRSIMKCRKNVVSEVGVETRDIYNSLGVREFYISLFDSWKSGSISSAR